MICYIILHILKLDTYPNLFLEVSTVVRSSVGDSCGKARADAPGLSGAREKAGAGPAESVRRSGEPKRNKITSTYNPYYNKGL